jgi:hypothetical protein
MHSEADLIAKRAALRWLAQQHPQWTHQDLAEALSMSRSWVSKWLQRLHQADSGDVMALHSRSRARHTPPASIVSQPAVVLPLDMVDKSVCLCKDTSGWCFHLEAVRRGHLSLE